MLEINKTMDGTNLTMALVGRLDTTTAPELEADVKGSLEGISELTMDMEGLEYVSSAGLRILLMAQKTMNKQGSMKVIHVSKEVMDIFDVTGFSDFLTIQ